MKTPDEQQLENIRIHLDMLCSDDLRQHGFISHEHETDFQVFRTLCGYNELMDDYNELVEAIHGLLGAYSNGEFVPNPRFGPVVRESSSRIAELAREKVVNILRSKNDTI